MNQLITVSILLGILLATCILFTTVFTNRLTNSQLYDSLDRSSPIDAMRGVLALSVMTHHFYITYVWKTVGEWKAPEILFLDNLGAVGVSLFFLTTGFLFLNKIKKNIVDWKALYISRFRRILPLFFFAATIVILITFMSIDRPINDYESLKFIFKWLVFLGRDIDSFQSVQIIAGVHWSLIYEWAFYLLLPFIFIILHKKSPPKIVLALCFIPALYILTITGKKIYLLFVLSYLSIFFKDQIKDLIRNHESKCNILVLSILLFTMCFTHAYSIIQQILVSIVFAFIANGLSLFVLNNKGLKVLGDISYSIYLMHGIILYTLFTILNIFNFKESIYSFMTYYPLVFIITIFTSLFTHKFIEKKFIENHRKDLNKLTQPTLS
ncbi:acyltransferase family protein [Acinetobacter johnsonii]|uniref:acyltransferase family protein n=1 Tax=Acinetobacter johnsonii TaxID=40214 RepID=UPI003AF788B8